MRRLPAPAARSTGLLDGSGRPVPASTVDRARRGGMRGFAGGSSTIQGAFPYDAAAWSSQEMGDWNPWLSSPDREINVHRDRMVARQRDLVRNDGWASGAIGRILDSTIGPSYRRICRPDWRAMSALYGSRYDAVWAREYRTRAEAIWRTYSEDEGRYNDVSRQLTVAQQFRLNLRHKLVDGEGLTVRYWLPDRIGYGAARYATAHLVVDPDRLSNPHQQPDGRYMRSGVEIDDYGVPIAYHIRKAHQNDWYNAVESMQWDRVVREDADGFVRVLHDYDRDRAGQSRGVSVFAPILSRMKMLARYYGVKLQAATVASALGLYVTSPMDQKLLDAAFGDDEEEQERLSFYQDLRQEHTGARGIKVDGVSIAELAPGEDIKSVSSDQPGGEFTPFAHEMLRSLSVCLGISAEQTHNDYSETNFSSARVGINESEKSFRRRLGDFNDNTATPVFSGVMHEAHDAGDFDDVLPAGAPPFLEARTNYGRGRWLSAARGWNDPVAERQGKVLGLDAGFDTLEDVCAEQGAWWEDNLDQRADERARCEELNIPPPVWMGAAVGADDAAQKPKNPEAR